MQAMHGKKTRKTVLYVKAGGIDSTTLGQFGIVENMGLNVT